MPAITARELVRAAEKLGFAFDRQKGSHAVYVRPSDGSRIVIPIHAGRDIKPKTLAGILDDMGISLDRLRELV